MLNKHFQFMNHIVTTAIFIVFIATAGFSQGTTFQPTPAQRQKMSAMHKQIAEMHLKMATCLESEKSPSQCRQDMQETCSANFGGSCPMMGMGMGKMGGRGKNAMKSGSCMDWMTTPPPETANPSKPQPAK